MRKKEKKGNLIHRPSSIGCISDEEADVMRKKVEEFKDRFNKDFQDRACKNDWKHDYYFSHYESDQDPSSTATLLSKYAVMICRHCGQYLKQQIF